MWPYTYDKNKTIQHRPSPRPRQPKVSICYNVLTDSTICSSYILFQSFSVVGRKSWHAKKISCQLCFMQTIPVEINLGWFGIWFPTSRNLFFSRYLLQTRCITQSVVRAMMWQLASTHGYPMVCPYLLAIWCHYPWAKQTASHQQTAQPDSYFPAGIIWLGDGWSSALLNCLIPWNLCDIASYPKDRLVE